jgi:hypothetical protein
MVLGNRGQGLVLAVMLFMLAFIVAVIMVSPIKSFIEEARSPTSTLVEAGLPDSTVTRGGLNCEDAKTNTSVSDGVIYTCLVIDLVLPFFIATVILAGTAYFFYFIGRG